MGIEIHIDKAEAYRTLVRWVLGLSLAPLVGIAAVLSIQGWPADLYVPHAIGLILFCLAAAFLVVAPSVYILFTFLVFMLTAHQFHSFFMVSFGGVELHPRELLLGLVLLHGLVKWGQGNWHLQPHPLHAFLATYLVLFAWASMVGMVHGADMSGVVAELRNPFFVLAFFCFAHAIPPYQVHTWLRVVCALTVMLALLSLGFFFYTRVTGHIINVQNALGEFVRRSIDGNYYQSIRLNGHHLFEMAIVVVAALLFRRDRPWYYKLMYLLLILLFAMALGVSFMRTAALSLLVAFPLLLLLSLPRGLQRPVLFLGCIAAFAGLAYAGWWLYLNHATFEPQWESSLMGRWVETRGAWQAFLSAPITGMGLGAQFTEMGYVSNKSLLSVTPTNFVSLHNSWLYYLYKGGLVGVFLALVSLGGVAAYGYRLMHRLRFQSDRCLVRGILAAYCAQLVVTAFMPRLTYANGTVLIAFVAVVFFLLDQQERNVVKAATP